MSKYLDKFLASETAAVDSFFSRLFAALDRVDNFVRTHRDEPLPNLIDCMTEVHTI